MNIRQLKFFCLAASTGTFSAAAQKEGVTVQAVSKSIHELEEELGGPLFARAGKGVRLTPLGETILEPARDAMTSFELVERAARSWDTAVCGRSDLRLALVTPPFSKHEFICGVIARLMTRSLGISTQLSISVGSRAYANLMAGALDALFTVGRLSAPQCSCVQIGSVMPGVFLGRNHPLRKKPMLSFADLEPYPALWSEEIDGFNDTVLVTCRKAGLASPLVPIDTNEGVVDFLESQNGFIMGINLKALSIRPFAMMHDVDPADAPSIPVCLVTRAGQRRTEVERLRQFTSSEFSLMKRLFNADKTMSGY